MTMTDKTQIDSLVAEMAADPDIIKLVSHIEESLATTKNHYGNYGSVISRLSNGNKTAAGVIASALVLAGANKTGVSAALKNLV